MREIIFRGKTIGDCGRNIKWIYGHLEYRRDAELSPYCPHCGARMDEEDT